MFLIYTSINSLHKGGVTGVMGLETKKTYDCTVACNGQKYECWGAVELESKTLQRYPVKIFVR